MQALHVPLPSTRSLSCHPPPGSAGLVEGLGSLAAADIIFARSRPLGATKLRFQVRLGRFACAGRGYNG